MKLAYLVAFASLFIGSGAEDKPAEADEPAQNVVVAPARPDVVPLGPVLEESAPKVVNPEPEFVAPELPAGMKVVVNSKGGAKMLTLVHQGHLVSLRRGDTVVLGDNAASAPMKDVTSMVWESSDRKTFETLRGVVQWDGQAGAREVPTLRTTAKVSPTRGISGARHECKSFEEANDVVTVMCRVDSLAVGAARPFGAKPQAGISMLETGEHRYFRMDLDTSSNEFDAVVIGYSDGARGHVIRAEASKLPGETKPSFSLREATRAQPVVVRRFFHHRHPPHDFDLL